MKAHAAARAVRHGDRTVFEDLRSDPPLVLRETPSALYLVGGAAGPLGGDELHLDLAVETGATLHVHSAAATMVFPGPRGARSISRLRACVAGGASLVWHPEPLVSVFRSDHLVDTAVRLAGDAQVVLRDEIVLGRAGEESGRLVLRTRVDRDGAPLFAHDIDIGPGAIGSSGPAVLGGARAIIHELVVGPGASAVPITVDVGAASAAWLPLADRAALCVALAPTLIDARRAIGRLVSDCE